MGAIHFMVLDLHLLNYHMHDNYHIPEPWMSLAKRLVRIEHGTEYSSNRGGVKPWKGKVGASHPGRVIWEIYEIQDVICRTKMLHLLLYGP